ncbi:MAG: hypothetical protein C0198_03925 [Sulfurihydrogenibium sp.]|nr:MAG: hypothetical protein C0198_03925 [Sulfurihydrogenibium sp.]
MKSNLRIIGIIGVVLLSVLLAVSLTGCGGGGGGTTGGGGGTTPQPQILSGTVATGKPLSNVPVYLKDSKGNVKSTLTDANGKFSFDTTGLTPPFYLRTQGYGLFSYTDQQSGTANITPLTTAVVAVANNGNADIYTNPPSQLNLDNAKSSLRAFLSPVLQKYGVQNTDFITTPFDANGQGMDAVIDRILISVNSTNQTIEVKNPFTGGTIGTGTFTNGSVSVSDSIDSNEANSLPQSVTSKKYFAYVKDNYDFPEQGPVMVDVVEGNNGQISVTITATEGDTGDLFLIYGNGTRTSNNIQFTAAVILCSDTNPEGTGTASFTGTIGSNGNITGTFTNTLSPNDTCKENNSNIYKGTWKAEDVTNASPTNIAGTYDIFATPKEYSEEGPYPLQITQSGSIINVSVANVSVTTVSGQGIVYGNYLMFRLPVIVCHDTCINGVCPDPEYATFFGRFDSGTNIITGIYGDGVPAGDRCKAPDYDRTKRTVAAKGTWRAVKR